MISIGIIKLVAGCTCPVIVYNNCNIISEEIIAKLLSISTEDYIKQLRKYGAREAGVGY